MVLYYAASDEQHVPLGVLNRAAAGSQNGPGIDEDGLNLYSTPSLLC
jgi:hypothetical protein